MDKITFQNKISEIGTCEDEVQRRELLAQLQEEVVGDYDRLSDLETTNSQLTSDNETLRSANMKLFLRVGEHRAPNNDKLPGEEKEKRDFKDLFNEKGAIK